METTFPTWSDTNRQSTETAVSRYPRADVERLISRLEPLAKVPHFVATAQEAQQAISEWTKQGHKLSDALIVWRHLQERHEADRDNATIFDTRFNPGVGPHRAHGLRKSHSRSSLTATEYYTLKGDSDALGAIEVRSEQPDLLRSLAELANLIFTGKTAKPKGPNNRPRPSGPLFR